MSGSRLLATRTIELSQTPKRAARQAYLEIRAITVEVKPPHARSHLPSVTHNVVLVEEVGGPGDGTDVSWLLLTTLPIETLEEILCVIDHYVARWIVEIYFRTLKTGCRMEGTQLETNHRLKNCLAFYQIIAWRILFLTYLNRTCPKLPCSAVFADSEWKSVWRVVKKKPLPKKPPVLSGFLQLLTPLGGDNNRATEAPPGPQPLWIGLRRMTDFATAWLNFVRKSDRVVYQRQTPTTDGKQPSATGQKANHVVTLLKAAHEDRRLRGSDPFHLKTVRQIRSTSPRHEPVPSQHLREEKPGLLKLAEYDAPQSSRT